MSTADHAGRPVGPSSAGRGPYADGGNSSVGRSSRGGASGALSRLAGSDSSSGSRESTRPVPVTRDSDSSSGGASSSSSGGSGTSTTALPKYPEGYTPRTGGTREPTARDDRRDSGDRNGRQTPPEGSAGHAEGRAVAEAQETTPARRSSDVPPPARPAPARRVRLTVSRVDPWSAMKMSFLLSVALGIAGVVAVAVLWTVLEGMGVFDQVNGVIGQVIQDEGQSFDILDFIGFTRMVSLSIVIGVVDVILITAIATLGAFLYNVSSALVGGVQLTLTDD